MSTFPDDLVSLREAERITGVPVTTMRNWIYQRGAHGLLTYRLPDDPHSIRVSVSDVKRWEDGYRRRDGARSRSETGRLSLTFSDTQAELVRGLAAKMAQKLEVSSVSCRDAVLIAVREAIQRRQAT